ncbi:MAG: nitrogenase component 1 [Methanoregulaceae archaeon]
MNIDPDGFFGTLLAIEGISDARAVLNGPTGCRGYPAYFSDRHYQRGRAPDRHPPDELFFFGQPRIPCTYLDSDDYIHGSTGKLREILPLIAAKGASLLAVVNSPGASLIGDDLNRFLAEAHLDHICMAFEGAAYSRPFPEGFDRAIASVLRWLKLNRLPQLENRVNLLGFSMIQKHWQGNIAEIRHLCDRMGLSVVSTPGAGSSVSELRESTTASCNLVVFPEYSRSTAEFYESEFGIPAVCSPDGAPVGFAPSESWIRTVAGATGRDPGPALDEIRRCRMHAYHQISRCHSEGRFPKGATFAVRADSSFVLPLTAWLCEYLGMVPVSLDFVPGEDNAAVDRVREFFRAHALSGVIGADPASAGADLYFGDGLAGRDLVLSGRCKSSVAVFNRMIEGPEFVQKSLLGGSGALWILECVFRGAGDFPG